MSAPPTHEPWRDTTAYERWYGSALGRAYAASLNAVVRPWLEVAAPRVMLDVGCGPGLTAGRALAPGAPVRLLELDCSFLMARRASARLAAEGHTVSSLVGTSASIPLRPGTMDLVLCVNCLEFVADRARSFSEIRRVLRLGGIAIIGVLSVASVWETTRRLKAPFVGEHRNYYRKGRFFADEELARELEAARLALRERAFAVQFPPLPGLPEIFYRAFDRSRRGSSKGAMLLVRAEAV